MLAGRLMRSRMLAGRAAVAGMPQGAGWSSGGSQRWKTGGRDAESKQRDAQKEAAKEIEQEKKVIAREVAEQRELLATRQAEFAAGSSPLMMGLYRLLNSKMWGSASQQSADIRASSALYDHALAHLTHHPALYAMCRMEEGQKAWFALAVLHVWMLLVRLRSDSRHGPGLSQELFNHFWADLEKRISLTVDNPFVLGRYQKDAFQRYHGTVVALDEGLAKGDAVLAGALFRNVLSHGNEEEVTGQTTARLVEYVHRTLKLLDENKEEDIRCGFVSFGSLPPRFGRKLK